MSDEIDEDPAEPGLVKRSRRYGMDHLYVDEADSKRIGWVELETGTHPLGNQDSEKIAHGRRGVRELGRSEGAVE